MPQTDDNDDEDDDNSKILVGCRVTQERKERWDEFLEESDEFGSMAQLIRTSVGRVVQNKDEDIQSEIDILKDDIGSVLTEIRRTRGDIEGLEKNIDSAEEIAEETVFLLERANSDE